MVEDDLSIDFRWLRSHLDLVEGSNVLIKGDRQSVDPLDFVPKIVVEGVISMP